MKQTPGIWEVNGIQQNYQTAFTLEKHILLLALLLKDKPRFGKLFVHRLTCIKKNSSGRFEVLVSATQCQYLISKLKQRIT